MMMSLVNSYLTRRAYIGPGASAELTQDETPELVQRAARLIIEEALEAEARDALSRDYNARRRAAGNGLSQTP